MLGVNKPSGSATGQPAGKFGKKGKGKGKGGNKGKNGKGKGKGKGKWKGKGKYQKGKYDLSREDQEKAEVQEDGEEYQGFYDENDIWHDFEDGVSGTYTEDGVWHQDPP